MEHARQYAERVLVEEERRNIPYALNILGHIERTRKNWEQAVSYYSQAIDIAEANQDHYMTAYAWQSLGKLYCVQGATAQGQQSLEKALTLFDRLDLQADATETRVLLNACLGITVQPG